LAGFGWDCFSFKYTLWLFGYFAVCFSLALAALMARCGANRCFGYAGGPEPSAADVLLVLASVASLRRGHIIVSGKQ